MYDGTLASDGPWQALVTFQQMIVLANQDGIVDMTANAIARRTSIPLEIIQLGIDRLMLPDTSSRTSAEEGRRIVLVEDHRNWGWQIVNYAKYRDLRKAEERRDYLRAAQQRSRANRTSSKPSVNNVNIRQQVSQNINTSTHVEVDVDVDVDAHELSGGPETSTFGQAAPQPDPPRKPRKPRSKTADRTVTPTAESWTAYSGAYEARYGTKPVRNATVNGQLAQLVGRIGAEEAPAVATFFLSHRNGLYVNAMHPVNLLLRDCEKLRTEWATRTQMTRAQANMADRTQTNFNSFAPLIAAAEERERAEREQQQ